MANTSDIRNGMCIDWEGDLYNVIEFQHVKPARGAAFVRTKLKSMTNGKTVDNTFPSGHKINPVRIERRKFQYLYREETGFTFMDNETFDQISIQEALINSPKFLQEGMECDVLFHAEKEMPLAVELPSSMFVKITYSEPGVKGDTATNSYKPATIESGVEIRVPLFINAGDTVKIDTATGVYLERAK
jgi:elongation factor P